VDGEVSFVPTSGSRTETAWDNELEFAQVLRWVKVHPERIHRTHQAAVAFVRAELQKS
jgi:hypothetical protein